MIPIRLSKDAANYIRNESEYLHQRSSSEELLACHQERQAHAPKLSRFWEPYARPSNRRERTLVTGDYLLDYSYDGSQIEVTSIRHGRMLTPTPDVEIDDDLEEGFDND